MRQTPRACETEVQHWIPACAGIQCWSAMAFCVYIVANQRDGTLYIAGMSGG